MRSQHFSRLEVIMNYNVYQLILTTNIRFNVTKWIFHSIYLIHSATYPNIHVGAASYSSERSQARLICDNISSNLWPNKYWKRRDIHLGIQDNSVCRILPAEQIVNCALLSSKLTILQNANAYFRLLYVNNALNYPGLAIHTSLNQNLYNMFIVLFQGLKQCE